LGGRPSEWALSIAATNTWPVTFGGNIELDYMRRAAEEQPLTLEMRPIAAAGFGRLMFIVNLAFEKPFQGPGTHRGVTFAPSGLISYRIAPWVAPTVEYYGYLGPVMRLAGHDNQEPVVVPTLVCFLRRE